MRQSSYRYACSKGEGRVRQLAGDRQEGMGIDEGAGSLSWMVKCSLVLCFDLAGD